MADKGKDLIIDSHAHLNFKAYEDDLEAVIKRTLDNNVWAINVGSQYETSKRAVKIAEKTKEGIYASVGLHPLHVAKSRIDESSETEIFNYDQYKKLARSQKVVAIGETGLDYFNKPKSKKKLALFKEEQINVFLKHLELARETKLPVILHCRMAHRDLIDILRSEAKKPGIRGVVHCFTGTLENARQYLEMGFYLGFTGIIFKLDLKEIIQNIPLNKILVETDCPYLTPPDEEGRNEPLYVKYVIKEIANIKKIGFQEVVQKTTQNAGILFWI